MGDLNIDLLKPDEVPERWSDIIEAFSLTQLINEPTRITEKSQTLLDHMYVTAPDDIRKHHVPKSGKSDHYPVCLVHKVSGQRNGHHTTITLIQLNLMMISTKCHGLSWTHFMM